MARSGRWVALGLLVLVGCVGAPEATRDGGQSCRADDECNPGGLCGAIRPCVQGFCAESPVFRVCVDGSYPDTGPMTGCNTYRDCNPGVECGQLIPCVSNRCDPSAGMLPVPCVDAGTEPVDAPAPD